MIEYQEEVLYRAVNLKFIKYSYFLHKIITNMLYYKS